jgi:uncharacterized protein YdeI (YjbR/CyaY-like superfamily)
VAFAHDRLALYAQLVAEEQRGASEQEAAERAGLAMAEARNLAEYLRDRLEDDPLLAERFEALVANAVAARADSRA